MSFRKTLEARVEQRERQRAIRARNLAAQQEQINQQSAEIRKSPRWQFMLRIKDGRDFQDILSTLSKLNLPIDETQKPETKGLPHAVLNFLSQIRNPRQNGEQPQTEDLSPQIFERPLGKMIYVMIPKIKRQEWRPRDLEKGEDAKKVRLAFVRTVYINDVIVINGSGKDITIQMYENLNFLDSNDPEHHDVTEKTIPVFSGTINEFIDYVVNKVA